MLLRTGTVRGPAVAVSRCARSATKDMIWLASDARLKCVQEQCLLQAAAEGHSTRTRRVLCREPKPFALLRLVVTLPIHAFDMDV